MAGPQWHEVDLFPRATAQTGSRFDDTVALPVDTPVRLAAVLEAATRRLCALPPPEELGHRTIAYRAQLQQIVRETVRAQSQLADGTYGVCRSCAAPISLALLIERPWRRVCVHCALNI